MTVDQTDLGLIRVPQTIQEAPLVTAIQALASGEGLNDSRKAKLNEYVDIFRALQIPIDTTAGNLESIAGL